jgi:hypothetical protein
VRKFHKKGLKDAKLPSFRLYDLRHTYASLLLAAGAPITYVSAQLGHSNPGTTLKYYARWIPSRGKRWVGSDVEPDLEPNRPETANRALRGFRSARSDWWAVKDSNLGPAD